MAASILGSLRSAASGGAVKQAESSGHVVAGQHFQEIQQSSSKLFSLSLWRFQFALRVSFMHRKGPAGSWKSHPNLPWYNRWNEREKDVSHCKTRTKAGGAANSLLALAPWVEVGTRKSGAKSSWSSSHYVFTAQ
jgi:hypothetical protein